MQIRLKLIRSINHAKSTVYIKFQLLVTFSSLFTASSSLPVFPLSVLYQSLNRKSLLTAIIFLLAFSFHLLLHYWLNSSCFYSLVVYLQAKINIALWFKSGSFLSRWRAAISSNSCKINKRSQTELKDVLDPRVAGSRPGSYDFF